MSISISLVRESKARTKGLLVNCASLFGKNTVVEEKLMCIHPQSENYCRVWGNLPHQHPIFHMIKGVQGTPAFPLQFSISSILQTSGRSARESGAVIRDVVSLPTAQQTALSTCQARKQVSTYNPIVKYN